MTDEGKLSQKQICAITTVIAIPSFKENIALPNFIRNLAPLLLSSDVILIVDDSPIDIYKEIKLTVENEMVSSKGKLLFSNSSKKQGRGFAIRRGMILTLEKFPNYKYFIECDADGSHRAEDIIKLRDLNQNIDLVIGSRYLQQSRIIGWSTQRYVFSKALNFTIPKLLCIPILDITNGLRRYSFRAVKSITQVKPMNNGFTYLAEQALIIYRKKLSIIEIPIIFIDRTSGKSTVTYKEIASSVRGIFLIILFKKRF